MHLLMYAVYAEHYSYMNLVVTQYDISGVIISYNSHVVGELQQKKEANFLWLRLLKLTLAMLLHLS